MLPRGTRYILPPESEVLREFENKAVNIFKKAGFSEIICPLLEYIDVIKEGVKDVGGIFTLTEPMTGKVLGIREDFTPQVVKASRDIKKPAKLYYRGRILRVPKSYFLQSIELHQVGAEVIGEYSMSELINLGIETMRACEIDSFLVVLGHGEFVKIFSDEFDVPVQILTKKDYSKLSKFLGGREEIVDAVLGISGSLDNVFGISSKLDEILKILVGVAYDVPAKVVFDLTDEPKRIYHTGVLFSVLTRAGEVLSGGEYVIEGNRGCGFGVDLNLLAGSLERS